ncbi:MAG TPA: RNA 3'-terminal phosphate cyclase [Candidatus Bathyarchaeia archaeon]|nr:RNA 3'-terminal phosphate cyclase [Candidatus Bathyarchaeia archaeon]
MLGIDGSFGEGGGQILRTSLALAAVLQEKVRIFNIRAGREVPGLRPQHFAAVKALAEICQASLHGLSAGSTELTFEPGEPISGNFRFDVGTAGSISLVLQTLMPLLPFLPEETHIEITGGTDVKWSPPIDYLRLVTLPILARMGYAASLEVVRRGHYPRGGGIVRLLSQPGVSLTCLRGLGRGDISRILGISHATNLPRQVAERQAAAAEQVISEKSVPKPEMNIDSVENETQLGRGSGIVLAATGGSGAILGGDCLGERGVPAERVGILAAQKLLEEAGPQTFLDRHMGDIIVPYLAIAKGESEVSVSQVTQHLMTNVRVVEALTRVSFNALGNLGEPAVLRVSGMGLEARKAFVSPKE